MVYGHNAVDPLDHVEFVLYGGGTVTSLDKKGNHSVTLLPKIGVDIAQSAKSQEQTSGKTILTVRNV